MGEPHFIYQAGSWQATYGTIKLSNLKRVYKGTICRDMGKAQEKQAGMEQPSATRSSSEPSAQLGLKGQGETVYSGCKSEFPDRI